MAYRRRFSRRRGRVGRRRSFRKGSKRYSSRYRVSRGGIRM